MSVDWWIYRLSLSANDVALIWILTYISLAVIYVMIFFRYISTRYPVDRENDYLDRYERLSPDKYRWPYIWEIILASELCVGSANCIGNLFGNIGRLSVFVYFFDEIVSFLLLFPMKPVLFVSVLQSAYYC